jgi:hypothetical protein
VATACALFAKDCETRTIVPTSAASASADHPATIYIQHTTWQLSAIKHKCACKLHDASCMMLAARSTKPGRKPPMPGVPCRIFCVFASFKMSVSSLGVRGGTNVRPNGACSSATPMGLVTLAASITHHIMMASACAAESRAVMGMRMPNIMWHVVAILFIKSAGHACLMAPWHLRLHASIERLGSGRKGNEGLANEWDDERT